MPIDPSIALSFKQGPGPLEMMGNAQSLANLVAQGEQNKLKAQEYQESRSRERSLRDLLAGGADEEKLLRGGFLKESQDLGKARREAEKSQADIAKAKSETLKNEIAAAKDRINFSGQAFGYVRQNPTMQNALGVVQSLVTKQMITPEEAKQYTEMIQSNPSPENIKALADQAFQSTLAAKDQLEKFETRNLGATTETIATNPVTGQTRVVNVANNTQSPDNKATVGASLANAAALREQATATRDAAKITAKAGEETSMRKEFEGLPEVKKLKMASPSYQAIIKASQIDNPQADINLIYGLAKLYDPESVVREGEYATIANSQAIPEWLKGQAQRLVGGGRLTKETKAQIVEQAKIRYGTFQNEYDSAKKSYEGIAQRRGMEPGNVFPSVGTPVDATPSGGPQLSPEIRALLLKHGGGK